MTAIIVSASGTEWASVAVSLITFLTLLVNRYFDKKERDQKAAEAAAMLAAHTAVVADKIDENTQITEGGFHAAMQARKEIAKELGATPIILSDTGEPRKSTSGDEQQSAR